MMGPGELLKYAGRYLFGVTSLSELPVTASCVVRLQNKHISPGTRSEFSPHPCQRFFFNGGGNTRLQLKYPCSPCRESITNERCISNLLELLHICARSNELGIIQHFFFKGFSHFYTVIKG